MAEEEKTIALIGAGGLGSPAAWGLISAAWNLQQPFRLLLLDSDCIETSNLNRQIFFSESDCTASKAEILSERLTALLPPQSPVRLESLATRLSKENIAGILAAADYVIDATDSVETKFLINDYCVAERIAFSYAGVVGTAGQLLSYDPALQRSGCLRCLFGDFSSEDYHAQGPTCRQAGIFGPAAGVLGLLQAEAALQSLAAIPDMAGKLFRYDMLSSALTDTEVPVSADCPLGCAKGKAKILDLKSKTCPSTFLYTKLALERLNSGELLDVRYSSRESVENVSRSALEEGFAAVCPPREVAKDEWRVLFQKS
jgi:adenylyltransferase/sulfurtransferase